MRVIRSEEGLTLVELLVSMTVMIAVLGATLSALDAFQGNSQAAQTTNAAQDAARAALTRMTGDLRDATGTGTTAAVLSATPWNLVVQAPDQATTPTPSNPMNLDLVRFCLDTTTRQLWRQSQPITSPSPNMTGNCPDSSWATSAQLAVNVSNGGTNRVFTYNAQNPSDVNAPTPALAAINSIRIRLLIDAGYARNGRTRQEATGVYLRNVGQGP